MTRIITLIFVALLAVQGRPVAQNHGIVTIRIDLPKKTPWEKGNVQGPILLGEQPALVVDWTVRFKGTGQLTIPSPSAFLHVGIVFVGQAFQLVSLLDSEMQIDHVSFPVGATTLGADSVLRVRGVLQRTDGRSFTPGMYQLQLAVSGLAEAFAASGINQTLIDHGYPIQLWIRDTDDRTRLRHYHLIEAAFHDEKEPGRALEHRRALANQPDATWVDSLAVGETLGRLGRHVEAVQIFRDILPIVTNKSIDTSGLLRKGHHFRKVAMSFAAVGDDVTAVAVLRAEGLLSQNDLLPTVRQLRQNAPKIQQR